MAIRTDQYTNTLSVVDTVNANASLSLVPQGTGSVSIPGTGQNFFTYSQTFTNAIWLGTNTSATDNTTVAPNGTTTAATVTLSVSGANFFKQNVVVTAGQTYTFSFYALRGTATDMKYSVYNNSASAELVAATSYYSSTNGSTWSRITLTFTTPSGCTNIGVYPSRDSASTGTFFVWGAQLEFGSTANTYIPTTASPIYGTPTLSFSGVSGLGLQSDGSLYASSAGTGNVRLYTNNVAQEQARISHTASAVNYVQITGAAAGNSPTISVQGSDSANGLVFLAKGGGGHYIKAGGGTYFSNLGSNFQFAALSNGTSVNYATVIGGSTGAGPIYSVVGSDTNIDINYTTKGTGSHVFNTGNGKQFQIADATTSSGTYTLASRDTANNVQLLGVAGGAANFGLYAANGGSVRIYTAAGLLEQQLVIPPTTSAVNYIQIKGGATGIAPIVQALGSDTNIPLVVQPKGTGALQAQQTDSTATGGNARGSNAVDFQTSRTTAAQIAFGQYSVVVGGTSNAANAQSTVVVGGQGNNASGTVSNIVGGLSNTSGGYASSIVGGWGNVSAGYFNFIGTGYSNAGTANAAVTTQSATMNGTTAVTLSGSNASIKVGQLVTGTSVQFFPPTYVAAISGTSLTLSQNASGSSTSTLSFFTPHGVVVGGGNNTATGSYSFIGGGGDAGTAANRNVASGDWSVVVGGRGNIASGHSSVVVGGGSDSTSANLGSTASGIASTISGGLGHINSGTGATISGGYQHFANSTVSTIAGGRYGSTRGISGYMVFPACNNPIFSNYGITQAALLILAKQTTDATATVLTSDSGAGIGNNQVVLPNNSAYFFTGEVVAGVTGGGNTKGWTIEGVIKRGANAASTTLVGSTVTSLYADAGAATWAIALSADTTNGGLAVTFTGQLATTIRVVCQVRTTEMTF